MISREEKISGGDWILEQLTTRDSGRERSTAKRVLSEVMRAWPGDVHRLWWKWFTEAASSFGLRSTTLDCTLGEMMKLAAENAEVVVYLENPEPEWLAVLGVEGRRFRIASVRESESVRTVSERSLKACLRNFLVDGKARCVIMQPQLAGFSSDSPSHKLTPFDRLWRLLRPEWSDIWIVLVFAFVVGLLTLATPLAVEALVNTVAFGRFLQPILVLALILLTFLGFLAAVRALQTYVVEIIQRRLFARVAADLAYRLPRTRTEAVDGLYLPEQVNRFFDIVTIQKVCAQLLLDGVAILLSTVIGMAVLGFYHPWLLGFDLVLLASIAFVIFVLGRGAVSSAVKESRHKYDMAAWLEDVARCPTAFRSDGGADLASERADRLIHNYLTARRSHFRVLMRQILFALGLQALASTVLLGLGGWLVVSRELTLAQLVAAELIVTAIVGAFAKLAKHMESFYDLMASVDKLGTLIDLPTERDDGMLWTEASGAVRLEINSAAYTWPDGTGAFLPVAVSVPAGSSLAIVGGSASGKSTLLDLIYGLRAPSIGHIALDGFDPGDLRPDNLRNRVALVRSCEVFNASIEENVHLHRPGVSASDVRDALRQAGLIQSVLDLDDGCETKLASGGAPLSGSQRTLLSLARAIAGRPGLILIDGVLDGLADDELESVLQCLLSPEHSWTLVIATGRERIAEKLSHRVDLSSRVTSSEV